MVVVINVRILLVHIVTILEQSIPVNSWGNTHFYSNPPHVLDYSLFRVISYYNNTVVTLNESDTVGPGEVWEDHYMEMELLHQTNLLC